MISGTVALATLSTRLRPWHEWRLLAIARWLERLSRRIRERLA